MSGEVARGTYVLSGSREAAPLALKSPGTGWYGGVVQAIDLAIKAPALHPGNKDREDTLASMAREGAFGSAALGYHPQRLIRRFNDCPAVAQRPCRIFLRRRSAADVV